MAMSFEYSEISLETNKTVALSEINTLSDIPSEATVEYTISDQTIATIDLENNLTTLKIGTATVTATADGESATFTLTVTTKANLTRLFKRIVWENGITKLNASNLNRIEAGIDAIDQQLSNFIGHFDISGLSGDIDFNDYVLKTTEIAGIPIGSDGISVSDLAEKLKIKTSGGIVDLDALKTLTDNLASNDIKVLLVNKSNNWTDEEITAIVSGSNTINPTYSTILFNAGFDAEEIELYAENYPYIRNLTISKNLLLNENIRDNYELIKFDIENDLGIQDYYIDDNFTDGNNTKVKVTLFTDKKEIYKYEVASDVTSSNVTSFYTANTLGDETYYELASTYDSSETYYARKGFNFRLQLWFAKNEE